jgi:hypothetical protein
MMSSKNDRNLEFGKPDRISLGFSYLLVKYFTRIKIWLVSILRYRWSSTDTDKNGDDFDENIGPLLEVYLTNHQGQ